MLIAMTLNNLLEGRDERREGEGEGMSERWVMMGGKE